ncbi:MAG: DNA polymerase I [Acidobacteriota bacterium]
MMEKKRIYLIDGTNQIFRAFYAIKSQLTNQRGLPTNAVYGFARMLKKLLAEKKPDYVACAFDLSAPTFRHEEFKGYKANRPEAPEELSIQFPYAKKVCEAFGVPVLEMEGYEADDLIGTLSRKASEEGFSVVIVASDKDLFQLVDGSVLMLNPQKEEGEIGKEEVMRIFGVAPERVVDVFSLWGDPVDNIPGVPGIGEKRAKEIIATYGSLEKVIDRAERFIAFFALRNALLKEIEEIEASSGAHRKIPWERFFDELDEAREKGRALLNVEKDSGFYKKVEELLASFEEIAKKKSDYLNEPEGVPTELRILKKLLKDLEKGSSYKSWESVSQHKDRAVMSRKLAKIEQSVPLILEPGSLKYKGIREEELRALFTELGFSSMLAGLEKGEVVEGTAPSSGEVTFEPIASLDDLSALEDKLAKRREAFIGLLRMPGHQKNREKIAISFYIPDEGKSYAFLLPSEGVFLNNLLALETLKRALQNEKIKKIGHDLKTSLISLRRHEIDLGGISFDAMLAAYLLDPSRKDFELPTIVEEVLHARYTEEKLEEEDGHIPEQRLLQNCARRAFYTARLHPLLKNMLLKENLEELYETVEMPLIEVLAGMEMSGVKIDTELLGSMSIDMEAELQAVSEEIYKLAGQKFNINSPKQLGDILFRKLGLAHARKTPKSREFATGMEVLEELSAVHPLPRKVLEYRSIAKMKATYVDALPALIDPGTGRVHTSFHQTGTATGRLSSSDPNLQNIPIRSESGKEIRKAFVPEEGYLFVSADYSQVELRILAHLSDDQDMIESFVKEEDIHRTTASRILGIPYESVTDDHRRFAKTINFGILYGMGAFRLSRELGISSREAQRFIDSYFQRFRRVRDYIDETTEFVRKEGYVTTLFGRVRYFKEIGSKNQRLMQQAIRQAVNTTIQGTAADLIKKAMISIHREFGQYQARMILQVHDELLFEVPEENVEKVKRLVKEKMEYVYPLKAPLIVNVSSGKSWADTK